ncbi:M24 family metallopeptidase [Halobacterium zhouii]|uniref:M24 family metallopeptidase n=1 Tax=Halobacterium zhouii TaxID=2902624 RepID=UPI001E60AE21|nr:M24 family metallopeptidase [Halobacterium zhouii]
MRLAALDAALAEADAAAFVHAGSAGDSTIRFLSGVALPCETVVVYDEDSVMLVPACSLPEHVEPKDGVTVLDPAPSPAERAAELADGLDGRRVLTPRDIPHDAALYLEQAGLTVASTDAHLRARERKTDAELDAVADAQAAAEAGMAAAASLLADASESGDGLTDESGAVTAARVRRAANVAVAEAGANPAGNTVVLGGGTAVESEDSALSATDPVAVRVAPRVRGYHGLLARTFVADSDGGWERRATLACERAIEMGLDFVDPGETTADAAAGEVAAELGSYGFPPTDASGDVYGVGLDRRERPVGEHALEPGAVVALEPRLDGDADDSGAGDRRETVWLADLAVVAADGAERLGSFPRSVVPQSGAWQSE